MNDDILDEVAGALIGAEEYMRLLATEHSQPAPLYRAKGAIAAYRAYKDGYERDPDENEQFQIVGDVVFDSRPITTAIVDREGLTKINEPFGDLDRATQMMLFEAWLEGAEIEAYFKMSDDWTFLMYPEWNYNTIYRVKPEPQRDIQVPWDYLPDWVQWVARDADGQVFLFLRRPEAGGSTWKPDDGSKMTQIYLKDVGDKPWDQSLIERPAKTADGAMSTLDITSEDGKLIYRSELLR